MGRRHVVWAWYISARRDAAEEAPRWRQFVMWKLRVQTEGGRKKKRRQLRGKRAAVMISFCLDNSLDKVIWGNVVYDWPSLMLLLVLGRPKFLISSRFVSPGQIMPYRQKQTAPHRVSLLPTTTTTLFFFFFFFKRDQFYHHPSNPSPRLISMEPKRAKKKKKKKHNMQECCAEGICIQLRRRGTVLYLASEILFHQIFFFFFLLRYRLQIIK